METLTTSDPAPRRRGRWKRWLALGLVLVIVLVALAPTALGPLLRSRVVAEIEARLDAHAEVEEVSFAWPGRLHVHRLELSDRAGGELASVDDVQAAIELFPLLSGKIHAEVEVAYPELHLARLADGRWNWEPALARLAETESAPDDDAESAKKLPSLRARLRVKDGHVVVHGAGGDTALSDLALEAQVEGLDQAAPFRLALNVRGPLGPAGGLVLAGSFTAAAGGKLGLEGFRAEAELQLEKLDLSGLAPALAQVAPVQGLAGIVSGNARLELGAGLAVQGSSAMQLSDLALVGPLSGGVATRIAKVELTGQATQQGEGAGTQHLELKGEEFLALVYDGRSNLTANGAGQVSGTLTLSADLERLTEIARGWVPLQQGVVVQGRLQHSLELSAELQSRRPTELRVSSRGGLSGLAARDAAGRALDLEELAEIGLELDAAADLAQGTLDVSAFALHAGPLSCDGHARLRGLPGVDRASALDVTDGGFRLQADLERLRGTLAQVVDVGALDFGGHLSASGALTAQGTGLALQAELDGSGLAFAGTSLERVHGTLNGVRAADGALSGTGRAELGALTLALEGSPPLDLPGARANLTVQRSAAGRGAHSLGLETNDGALKLALQATSDQQGADLELVTTFKLDGRIEPLFELARPLLPAPAEGGGPLRLAGDLRTLGEVHAKLRGGALASGSTRLEVSVTHLSAREPSGRALPLEELAQSTLSLEAELDGAAGSLELRSLALAAGTLQARASGRALGLALSGPLRPAAIQVEGGHVELEADLARLGPELGQLVDLGPLKLGGSPLRAQFDLALQQGRLAAQGKVSAQSLTLEGLREAPLALTDLDLALDLDLDPTRGSLALRRAEAHSQTATLALSGELEELFTPERARGKMRLEFGAELARILGDLGLEGADSGRKTAGKWSGSFDLDGDGGAFRLKGSSAIEDFRLELAAAKPEEAPLVIAEPKIAFAAEAGVSLARLDVDLAKLTIESGLLRGGAKGRILNLRGAGTENEAVRIQGLTGEFAYLPDRLGVVLAPWLPGQVSGAEEKRVTFSFDGSASELDLAALLTQGNGRIDLDIGRFVRPEIELGGALGLEAKDGKTLVRGDLTANGGTLQVDGSLDFSGAEKPRSRLKLAAKELRANSGLAPLLALVHPAFASANLTQGSLAGLIGLDLDVTYEGPLTLESLAAGWEKLPKDPINGTGRLELRSASLSGSPLLRMLAEYGVNAERTLDLKPIEFTIKKGRLTYAKPWTWTLSGTETTFTGSVGLDQSLDLAWNLPVSEALVQRYGFLSSLKGENLSIPLRGSVQKPELAASDLFKSLAAKVAKKELEARLGGSAAAGDPEQLLGQADELWTAGKKLEAAKIYLRLREDFKLSLTYALNKDRIKDRSKYQPPK